MDNSQEFLDSAGSYISRLISDLVLVPARQVISTLERGVGM